MTARFAHGKVLFGGLTWLRDRVEAAAASFRDTDWRTKRLWITLNGSAPTSGVKAWNDAVAKREIHSEEMNSEVSPLFQGPVRNNSDTVLYIAVIGSLRGDGGTARCACFLERQLTKRGDPSGIVCTLLYMVPVTGGGTTKDEPVRVGPWCIKNFWPTGDCELPPGFGG